MTDLKPHPDRTPAGRSLYSDAIRRLWRDRVARICAVVVLVYIGIGMVALRFGRSRNTRLGAWLFGLLTFLYIVSVALSKSVLGLFVYF